MSENCSHNCESCSADCESRKAESLILQPHEQSNIKKVIAVVSGKGGVGKSLVTGISAVTAQRDGYSTAILDADITGPSIPKMFGIHKRAMGNESVIIPVESRMGTRLMSLNLLTENETDPAIWRGPVIAGTVKQFWTDVLWGDVDFMFIDMPPGTGDVPLTVFQSIPVDGIIIVTSPQELVSMIVEKAVKMADMMNIPILGIVENMSYVVCPDCGKKINVFGESRLAAIAAEHDIEILGQIPMDPALANNCDSGLIELYEGDWLSSLSDKFYNMMQSAE